MSATSHFWQDEDLLNILWPVFGLGNQYLAVLCLQNETNFTKKKCEKDYNISAYTVLVHSKRFNYFKKWRGLGFLLCCAHGIGERFRLHVFQLGCRICISFVLGTALLKTSTVPSKILNFWTINSPANTI